jgi:RHS repeat-associated protein
MMRSESCASIACFPPSHFTGKERDSESGNDYFGARYYASSMGRWLSPDPTQLYYADPMNPQSFNLYSFVINNPLVNIDPDGMDCIHINVDSGAYEGTDRGDCDNSTEEKANSGQYVDGTVNTVTTTTGDANGVVTGYSGVNNDTGALISGSFASPLPPEIDPDDARIDALVQGVATDTKDFTNLANDTAYCVADNFGLTLLTGGTALAGAPVAKSALGVGNGLGGNASPYTSGLGAAAFKVFGANEPKFSGALGRLSKGLTGTARVAGAAGRIAQKAAPVMAVVNAASIVHCVAKNAK